VATVPPKMVSGMIRPLHKGVNRNLITLSSAYVPASRAKEHMQTYTDDKEGWINLLNKNLKSQVSTAHDALEGDQIKWQKVADMLLGAASPMRSTALGRHVLKDVVSQINHQATTAPAPSDRYTRGFLIGRPRVFSLLIAPTYAITSPT
jgi:hypothetical protein